MEEILKQIENGLELNQYYLSLFTTLAIPDICGALESEDGFSSGEKYKKWFDKWIAPKYNSYLNGHSCYCFRCSLLHQGSTQHRVKHENQIPSKFDRILFIEPKTTNIILHNNIINNVLNIDIRIFCQDVISGAKMWLTEYKQSPNFIKNYPKLIRRYPKGLPPYIDGISVIS